MIGNKLQSLRIMGEKMKQDKTETIRQGIKHSLGGRPYIFRQSRERQELDGISAGGLANLDSAGRGPGNVILVGRKAAYLSDVYIDWLVSRITEAGK